MAFDNLAQKLFGARRAESNAVLTDATTGTIHGTALTDSADGAVTIEIDGDVTVPEEIEVDGEVYYGGSGVGIEVPTSENVKAGDEVLVSVYGEGTMRSPAVTSAIGSGDRIAADAEAAREIAEATGQHFWDADDGAHVTEATREEWEQQQSGPNSLWNSLGMLFRDGLHNLLAIVTGQNPGLQIYDGQGNADENIVASFTSEGQRVGNLDDFHSMVDEKSFGLYLGSDRLINFSSDGLLTSVYLGGSTAAPGKDYTDAQVQALLSALQDGCYIVDQTKVYDKNDKDTGFRLKLPYDSLGCAQVRDRYASIVISANFKLLYSNGSTYAQGFRIEPVQSPATEVPGAPVDIAMGGTTANAQNGSLSVNAGENITLLANASSNRLAYTSVSLNNTSGGVSSVGIRAKHLSLVDSATMETGQFTMQHVIDMLTTKEQQLTRQSGAASWLGGQARRCGKIVVVTVNGMKLASALASGITSPIVGTIPAGLRPNVLQRVPAALYGTGNFGNVWVAIGASGKIQIRNASPTAIPTTNEISFSCTYIID